MNLEPTTKQFQYGKHSFTLETGRVARQASGAVLVHAGDTTVLVTAVAKRDVMPGQSFFPLTIDYREKSYAAGKIPGGFFKREGRPTEKETLVSRLIDRPLRPLFPEGFRNEVHVVATVLSLDPEVDADIPAMIGASAALAISGAPFMGPIGAARVGYIDGQFILNPTFSDLDGSELELVVAGTEDAVLMVESDADELPESVMLDAVMYGHEQMQVAIKAIKELAAEAGKQAWDWQPAASPDDLIEQIEDLVKSDLEAAYQIQEKQSRVEKVSELSKRAIEALAGEEEGKPAADEVKELFHNLEKKIVRSRIIEGQPRIDGRNLTTVRPIDIQLGVLPRTHGSALFTRGETQALVTVTLGTGRDAQIIDALEGEYKEHFMLHYNFPPYSVGETGFLGGPKRREIGHGFLARRGVESVLPQEEDFPYVVRVVSEITESNGSSSMATVCGSSLALMDAGVAIRAPVAGIAMGLIKEDCGYAVLTDILGDEDHLGDMDFKVAGTGDGVTALQMDIKINGITKEIMEKALAQARDARLHILGRMAEEITAHRPEMSAFAPRITSMTIPTDKIRDVIGKGGATIRALTEETGATIDINDEGVIHIAAVDGAAAAEAKRRIELLTVEAKIGDIYEGKVVKVMDFGAFVNILPGKDGFLHVSQIPREFKSDLDSGKLEGRRVKVSVSEIDRQGRVRLTMKDTEKQETDA